MPLSWTPVAADVHAVLASRASIDGFTAETRPTAEEVDLVIDKVAFDVVAALGDADLSRVMNPSAPVGDRVTLADLASKVVTIGAAAEVERSFFPEQQVDHEAETSLFRQFRESLTRLTAAASLVLSGGTAFVGSAPLRLPALDYDRALGAEAQIR